MTVPLAVEPFKQGREGYIMRQRPKRDGVNASIPIELGNPK